MSAALPLEPTRQQLADVHRKAFFSGPASHGQGPVRAQRALFDAGKAAQRAADQSAQTNQEKEGA